MADIDVSFIFPCLNEEKTIAFCLNELKSVLQQTKLKYEIIISDNGSTDKSIEIANSFGVKVINTPQRGYGAALKNGFAHAQGKYLAFADIDGSYPLEFLPEMYKTAEETKADMVVASRMKGKIEPNAMPFLHRYLGTPILTFLINLLFRGKLSDCNSGFRLMKRSAYEQWQAASNGMEFASELLIKALKHKAKIVEIPAGLRVDKRDCKPHLNTWNDGMRHLLFILSESPRLFEAAGGLLFICFSLLFAAASFSSPITIGRMRIFDYHTQLICISMATIGVQIWLFSAMLYLFKSSDTPSKISGYFINLKEDKLFFIFCCILLLMVYCFISVFMTWSSLNFGTLNMLYVILRYVYVISVLGSGALGLLILHIVRNIVRNR